MIEFGFGRALQFRRFYHFGIDEIGIEAIQLDQPEVVAIEV